MARVPPPVRPGKPLVPQIGELFADEVISGVFMLVDSDTFHAHSASLESFLHDPPLNRVWAGDVAENPQWSVVVKFPSQAVAALERAKIVGGGT